MHGFLGMEKQKRSPRKTGVGGQEDGRWELEAACWAEWVQETRWGWVGGEELGKKHLVRWAFGGYREIWCYRNPQEATRMSPAKRLGNTGEGA